MSLILNIHTALSTASVCLAVNGDPIQVLVNNEQKDHAGWLHSAIKELLDNNKNKASDLSAVAVTIGPGSYTGLRVGLASAKGFCYALNIPLITINTLALIAYSVKDEDGDLIIPMIDARRMEVYTAVFDKEIREKISTHALILDPTNFSSLLSSNKIIFCGDGSKKFHQLTQNPNAIFSKTLSDAGHLSCLSEENFVKNHFASLAYTEPLYVKDFNAIKSKD
jgi:tRNA threonylcarbamoyladenosine biosynthesis protein TsaB